MMAPVCSGSAADEAVFWRERAGCLAAENVRLAGTVAVQREQIAALKQRVVTLSRMLFGTSSEKGDPGRPEAGGGDGDGPGGGGDGRGDGGGAGEGRRGQRPGSAGHGRRRHDHLEAEEQVHDVPEGERRCPRCGRAYELFGEDASEQVSWRVRVWRIVHRRRKYARSCRCPVPAVVTAPGPAKLTGRGLFTTEFCVNLLVAKYALGLPFNRVIAMLSFQGLEVAPGTLAGVARRLDILLAPLAGAIAARNAAARWSSARISTRCTGRFPSSTASRRCGALPTSAGGSSGPATPTARSWAPGPMPGPPGSGRCTRRTGSWPPPRKALPGMPARLPRSRRRWRTSTLTAAFRGAARTCCTRPRRRCWPPWTANGTGWPATVSSPACRWTTTPPSGPSAPRSRAARTTADPARGGPRTWPAAPGPSWARPGSPGTTPAPT